MSCYADHYPIIRQLTICLQAAEELTSKLPDCHERRRLQQDIAAAERSARLLEAQLVEEDQIARDRRDHLDRLEIAEVAQ